MPDLKLEDVISQQESRLQDVKVGFISVHRDHLEFLLSEIRKRDEALNYLKGKVGYHNILCDLSKEPCFTCAIINKTNQILRGEK